MAPFVDGAAFFGFLAMVFIDASPAWLAATRRLCGAERVACRDYARAPLRKASASRLTKTSSSVISSIPVVLLLRAVPVAGPHRRIRRPLLDLDLVQPRPRT